MPRVKGGTIHRARRKKVMQRAKGFFGSKHRLYKTSKEQVMHSLKYSYRDRRQKKRDFRKLWITRINAACRENNISYSKFINGLNKADVKINRKMLASIAIDNPKEFTKLVEIALDGLNGKVKTPKVALPKEEKASKNTKDYSKMTVAELKSEAAKKGIKGISTMKKADLIAALN